MSETSFDARVECPRCKKVVRFDWVSYELTEDGEFGSTKPWTCPSCSYTFSRPDMLKVLNALATEDENNAG